jgi:hypothetical protein
MISNTMKKQRLINSANVIKTIQKVVMMSLVALSLLIAGIQPVTAQVQIYLDDRPGYNSALPATPGLITLEDFKSVKDGGTDILMSRDPLDPDQWNGFTAFASSKALRGSAFGPSGYLPNLNSGGPYGDSNTVVSGIGYNSSTPDVPGMLLSVGTDDFWGGRVTIIPDRPVYAVAFDFIDWNDGTDVNPDGFLRYL